MTIAAIVNARTYDWQTWLMGIMRSFIGGGAGAVISGVTTMGFDPAKFNLVTTSGVIHILAIMFTTFILQGLVHLAMFLQTHGAPELVNGYPVAADGSTPTSNGAAAKAATAAGGDTNG